MKIRVILLQYNCRPSFIAMFEKSRIISHDFKISVQKEQDLSIYRSGVGNWGLGNHKGNLLKPSLAREISPQSPHRFRKTMYYRLIKNPPSIAIPSPTQPHTPRGLKQLNTEISKKKKNATLFRRAKQRSWPAREMTLRYDCPWGKLRVWERNGGPYSISIQPPPCCHYLT